MDNQKSKVYFTKIVSPERFLDMYKVLGITLPGNVAVKIHSGEKGNMNFIRPEFLKPLVDFVDGTVVETNTSHTKKKGTRNTTEKHRKLLEEHGWTKVFKKVEILDDEGPDDTLEIPQGNLIKKNYVGKNMKKYDSILVTCHFKGHLKGGYGACLKQLSIGFASTRGKSYIHTKGFTDDQEIMMEHLCSHIEFKETMAEAASSIVNLYRGKMAFVTLMANISVDCDCDKKAKPPCMKDIGILSSTDPVALDKACLDLIYNSDDPGKTELIERIESKLGPYVLDFAEKLGIGKKEYELIDVDK